MTDWMNEWMNDWLIDWTNERMILDTRSICAVASLGKGREADRPGWHPPGGDTRRKNLFVCKFTKNSGETRSDRWKRCGVTPSRGWHPSESNKKRLSDEQKNVVSFVSFCEEEISGDTAELATKKVARFFRKKIEGWHPHLPPRVSPTLVTPLHLRSLWI